MKRVHEQPILETERLRLRPFVAGDAARVQALAGDQRVAAVTANIPHPYPDGAAAAWIATHPDKWRDGTAVVYAVTLKADEALIGAVSIVNIADGAGELGYWIGVPYWGRGYCTEAAGALVGFMARTRMVLHFHAHHLSANPASGRVLIKIGFAHCGSSVAQRGSRQEPETIEVYELRTSEECNAELEAVRQALIDGERSGEPQPFDFTAFTRRKIAERSD